MSGQTARRGLGTLLQQAFHPITYTLYPLQTGVPAVGVALAAGNAIWGALADIVPALTSPIVEFWLTQIHWDTTDGNQFDVRIRNTTLGVNIFETRIHVTVATVNLAPTDMPFPIPLAALTQVQGQAAGTNTKVIGTSLLIATGL